MLKQRARSRGTHLCSSWIRAGRSSGALRRDARPIWAVAARAARFQARIQTGDGDRGCATRARARRLACRQLAPWPAPLSPTASRRAPETPTAAERPPCSPAGCCGSLQGRPHAWPCAQPHRLRAPGWAPPGGAHEPIALPLERQTPRACTLQHPRPPSACCLRALAAQL